MKKSNQKRHLDHLAIQSGDFNMDFMVNGMGPQDLVGGREGASGGAGGGRSGPGMTAKDIREALAGAEDEADRAAAALAQKEEQADLAEFVADPDAEEGGAPPPPPGEGDEKTEDPPPEENVFDFKSLKRLLSPVDLYAIRFYESLYPFDPHLFVKVQDVEVAGASRENGGAAAAEEEEVPEDVDIQEFNEEDVGELNVVRDWDAAQAEIIYASAVQEDLARGV